MYLWYDTSVHYTIANRIPLVTSGRVGLNMGKTRLMTGEIRITSCMKLIKDEKW